MDYSKQPYNLYRRYRMFRNHKQLFRVMKGKRKRYLVSTGRSHCEKKYSNSGYPNSGQWKITRLPKVLLFFIDVFNFKDIGKTPKMIERLKETAIC